MSTPIRFQIDNFISALSKLDNPNWICVDPSDNESNCNRIFTMGTKKAKYRLCHASPTIECVFFTVDKENKPQYKLEVVFSDKTDTVYEMPINSDNIIDLEALENRIITSLKNDFEAKITNSLHL